MPSRSCGAEDELHALLETSEEFRRTYRGVNRFAREHARAMEGEEEEEKRRSAPVTIPVVVHVVYANETENVSKAQIRSQLKVLNDDFMARNTDLEEVPEAFRSAVGTPGIRFKLAKRDPNGARTSGVTRTRTTVEGFGHNPRGRTGPRRNPVKFAKSGGVDAWPHDRYLNVWVCRLRDILGYASFPGMPPKEDGVVIDYRYFGTRGTATEPFDRGRTTTHKVGHWLNLRHIWGDDVDACTGTDHVEDTPNQAGPNYGRPTHPKPSCSNEGDMFMNYMDYVDDASMYMFSAGQVERMNATLDGPRSEILESDAARVPRAPV